ncbi:hypothetical protein HDU99_005644 [Rhizoclosmatium hyalinum]|nr:hypothetical protein HDU99_005644 [Rhizoclosmatium hyalinum]
MSGDIVKRMVEGITQSKLILVHMSKDYEKSKNCQRELNFSWDEEKQLIPIRLDKGPFPITRFIVGTSLYYDFSDCLDDEVKKGDLKISLLKEIYQALGYAPTIALPRSVAAPVSLMVVKQIAANKELKGIEYGKQTETVQYASSPAFTLHSNDSAAVRMTIVAADGLVKRHWFAYPEPFCIISIDGDKKYETKTLKNTTKPFWNESFFADLSNESVVQIEVFDRSQLAFSAEKAFLGVVKYEMGDVFHVTKRADVTVTKNLEKAAPIMDAVSGQLAINFSTKFGKGNLNQNQSVKHSELHFSETQMSPGDQPENLESYYPSLFKKLQRLLPEWLSDWKKESRDEFKVDTDLQTQPEYYQQHQQQPSRMKPTIKRPDLVSQPTVAYSSETDEEIEDELQMISDTLSQLPKLGSVAPNDESMPQQVMNNEFIQEDGNPQETELYNENDEDIDLDLRDENEEESEEEDMIYSEDEDYDDYYEDSEDLEKSKTRKRKRPVRWIDDIADVDDYDEEEDEEFDCLGGRDEESLPQNLRDWTAEQVEHWVLSQEGASEVLQYIKDNNVDGNGLLLLRLGKFTFQTIEQRIQFRENLTLLRDAEMKE